MHRSWITLVLLVALLGIGPNTPAQSAPPTDWIANSAEDLINLIQLANRTPGADTIMLTSSLEVSTPYETGPDGIGNAFPTITSPMTIVGSSWRSTYPVSIQHVGDGRLRFFTIAPTGRLTLYSLSLSGGAAFLPQATFGVECQAAACGGAVWNQGGTLITVNSVFENNLADIGGAVQGNGKFYFHATLFIENTSTTYGGALALNGDYTKIIGGQFARNKARYYGGAAQIYGESKIVNVTFIENEAGIEGGALRFGGLNSVAITACWFSENEANSGGAVFSDATEMSVSISVFTGNQAQTGGAITTNKALSIYASTFMDQRSDIGGAIYQSNQSLDVDRTTFTRNQAIYGAALYLAGPHATFTNSTFSLNQASRGGAVLYNEGTLATDSPAFAVNGVLMTNVTLYGNSATEGAISYTNPNRLPSGLTLRNSLLIANGPFSSCASPVEDGGGNLVDVSGCGDMPITADLSIDLLAENGGPTQTHALSPDSPAINAGLAEFCPAVDQRNTRRDGCDVGAFELISAD